MKTVGIIGGVGPESTIDYYRLIIAEYQKQKPDGNYPPMIINSINLKRVVGFMEANDMATLIAFLVDEIGKLARAGCDFGVLASNTPHIVFDELSRQSPIPLISIVRATCEAAKSLGMKKLGLFGSGFTMRARFYPEVFSSAGISVIVPDPNEQTYIHNKYMDELVKGVFLPETRAGLLKIVDRLQQQQAIQGLILGGTELPLILRDVPAQVIPFLDTAQIHARAIVKEMLS
jgi:aspartate racemase